MASLIRPLSRVLATAARKPNFALINSAVVQQRFKSDTKSGSLDKPLEKKAVDQLADPKESYMTDPWELLYGAEKFEVAMKAKGFNDPYDSEAAVRKAKSSREDPNIVYVETSENFRIVGCACTPDTHHINYLSVNRGESKRCECGEWFKCVEREIPDLSDFGIHLEKSTHH